MTPITKNERIEELIRDIEETSEQVHGLLEELNASQIELAVLKTELKTIVDTVKELSHIVRNGNNDGLSIVARIVIIEQTLKEIKERASSGVVEYIEEQKNIAVKLALLEQRTDTILKIFENYNTKNESKVIAQTAGKWQLYVSSMTGVLALIGVILSYILQHC